MNNKHNICFFNTARAWGGGEKWHLEAASWLSTRGWQTMMIVHTSCQWFDKIKLAQLKYFTVKMTKLSFLNPFAIWQLYRLFKQNQIHTVIINLSADLKAAGLAAKLAGVRNIIYRRGSAIPIRNTPINRFIFKKLVTNVIANSQETVRTILSRNRHLIATDKIQVIYNGLPLQQFDNLPVQKLYQPQQGEILIGNAGRLVKQKAQHWLIDIAVMLKEKGLQFKILIAGSGTLEQELRQYAHKKKVDDVVVFLGFVADIKSFMHSIDIFVLTSQWEGFGYVIAEAMACKRPVVAFDISSNPELVTDGKTGYLVSPRQIAQMADKIHVLAQNAKLRQQMGNTARQIVEQRFDMQQNLQQLSDFLQKINQ